MTNKGNPTVKDINTRVEKMAEDFQRSLQEFKAEFASMKGSGTAEHQGEIFKKFNLFENSIKLSLNELKADVSRLKQHHEKLMNKLTDFENKKYYNYIIIHGLGEDGSDIYEKVLNLINFTIKVEVKKIDINQCYRLGKKRDKNNSPRPLAVQFCNKWLRDLVFFKKRLLKGSKVMMTEMLTDDSLRLFKKSREILGRLVPWTYSGLVYIMVDGSKVLIKSEEDLVKYQGAAAV